MDGEHGSQRSNYRENVEYDILIARLNQGYLNARLYARGFDLWTVALSIHEFLITDITRHFRGKDQTVFKELEKELDKYDTDMQKVGPIQALKNKRIRDYAYRDAAIKLHKLIMYGLEKENLLLKKHNVATGLAPNVDKVELENEEGGE